MDQTQTPAPGWANALIALVQKLGVAAVMLGAVSWVAWQLILQSNARTDAHMETYKEQMETDRAHVLKESEYIRDVLTEQVDEGTEATVVVGEIIRENTEVLKKNALIQARVLDALDQQE